MDQLINTLSITGSSVRYSVVVAATVVAGATDVYAYRISNRVTIPLLIGGLAYHAFVPGVEGFWFAFLGAFCGLLILMPIYIVGGIGAGDVKLLSGIGAWIGLHDFLAVFIVTALLSGVYSIGLMIVTRTWKQRMSNLFGYRGHPSKHRERIEEAAKAGAPEKRRRLVPFASFIALAVLILLFSHAFVPPLRPDRSFEGERPPVQSLELMCAYDDRARELSC